jgi:hypothetical protein
MAGTGAKYQVLRHVCWILIGVAGCCMLHAQQKIAPPEALKLFSLSEATLHYEQYPWGNETSLTVSGHADLALNRCTLALSVWYAKERVRAYTIPLKSESDGMNMAIRFNAEWGPLNNAWEDVLCGEYEIRLELCLDQQPPNLRQVLEKHLAGRLIQVQSKKIYWGTEEGFRQEDVVIKNFFAERMAKIYHLSQQLGKHVQLATSAPQAIRKNLPNPFVRRTGSAEFDVGAWRTWLSDFLQKLEQEHKVFDMFHKKIFSPRYAVAKNSMGEYYNLLLRLAKLSSMQIYQINKLQADRQDTNIDSFGLEKPEAVQLNLKRLLKMAAEELRLDLAHILKPK